MQAREPDRDAQLERLLGRMSEDQTELWLRCPSCSRTPDDLITRSTHPSAFKGTRSYTSAVARMFPAASEHYRACLEGGTVTCLLCGGTSRLVPGLPHGRSPYLGDRHFVHLACDGCGALSDLPLAIVTLALAEGWKFWQTHRRVRVLPESDTEVEGRSAIATTLRSVETGARLSALYTRDSLQLLGVYGE